MDRRLFLSSMLALCAAPAIVRATSLMPVRARGLLVWGPTWELAWKGAPSGLVEEVAWMDENGIRHLLRSDALQAAVSSALADGIRELWLQPGVTYPMPSELRITHSLKITGYGATIKANHDDAIIHVESTGAVRLEGIHFKGRGPNPIVRIS